MWLVYIEDTNGTRRLVGDSIDLKTKQDAEELVNSIVSKHSKPHKVDYYIVEYKPEDRLQTIKDLSINI